MIIWQIPWFYEPWKCFCISYKKIRIYQQIPQMLHRVLILTGGTIWLIFCDIFVKLLVSSNQQLLMKKQVGPFSPNKALPGPSRKQIAKKRESEKCQMLEQFCFISELCKQMIAPHFSSSCFCCRESED